MYERMLNKQQTPTLSEMADYCGETGSFFTRLNQWLEKERQTQWKLTFPYGNHYGWSAAHYQKKKLVCHVFAEKNAFTVMVRLSGKQLSSLPALSDYAQTAVENKYPCGDGGWIYYRVSEESHLPDLYTLLQTKLPQIP